MKRLVSLSTVFCLLFGTLPSSVYADNAITGGSDASGGTNTNIALNWQITGSGTIPVHLYVPSGTLSMTTTTGLTFTGSPTGSSLYFSGSLNDINTALATLQYNVGSAGAYTVEISLVEAGQIVYPATGHVYEVVNNGGAITATAARAAALARTYGGINGYLANITSAEENAFISGRLTQDGWFGASDITTEGTWQWLDGPVEEAGSTFWTGLSNGEASGYENWSNGEPNNSDGEEGPGEDCSEFYADGSGWNDLPCDWGGIDTYVVEYGTTLLGGGPTSASDSLTVTVAADTTTQSPTLTSPTSTSRQNALQLTYSLPEVPTGGTVTVAFNDGTTTTTLTMGNSQSVNTTVNLTSLASTSGVASTTGSSLADGTYTVTLSYRDYLGNPASTAVATAVIIDTTGPIISGINFVIRHPPGADISWTTDEGATSYIEYGLADTYGSNTTLNEDIVTAHSQTISSLAQVTTYHYHIISEDALGNSTTSGDFIFTTSGATPGIKIIEKSSEEEKTPVNETVQGKKKETLTPTEHVEEPLEVLQKGAETIILNAAPEVTCSAHVFLTKAIKLGAKNNPEDVKLLEQFLNTYEQTNLPVDGIYSREDYQAVIKWQEKYTDDVLKPWGLKKGTGYVYIKSLAKIREIEEKTCAEQKGQ